MAKTAQAVIETKVKDGASSGFRNMQREMDKTAKRGKVLNQQFRFMRGGLGQVGHQVQDVAVQLQMGQNAMLVFGQQGSQIASLFGPGGAMLGAFLAVGAALSMSLAPSFFGATESAKELKEANESLIDSFDDLAPAQQKFARMQAQEKLAEYRQELQRLNNVSRERLTILETGSFFERFAAKKGDLESIEDYNKRISKLDADIEFFTAAQSELNKKVDDTTTAFVKQNDAMQKEIATYGMSAREIKDYEIRQQLMRGEIELTEAVKLLHHNAELHRLDELRQKDDETTNSIIDNQRLVQQATTNAMNSVLSSSQNIVNGLMSATEKGTKEHATLFAIAKGIAVAQAIVGAHSAAASTMAAYAGAAAFMGPAAPAFIAKGMAMAGIVKALGYANAAVIAATAAKSYDGGGFTGSGARSGGLDGKGGFPAILHPNETVIDHTKGQGTGGVVVNQTINVTTGVQQTVRAEIENLMPKISENAKNAVANAKMRGGAYGRMMS